jgi:uncharacterized protein (TIGR02646 family)
MIKIPRNEPPPFLIDPNGRWMDEISEAIKHYRKKTQKVSFKFTMYNDKALKKELEEIFKGKCAYCESPYGAVYDGDVEHFRPKLQIDMGKGQKALKPGYYWLANTWENLLLSCMHCNQRRKHLIQGVEDEVSMGKLDQFPLSDEKKRAKYGDDLKKEEKVRLLINPCTDEPERHFEYEEREGVIRGLTNQGKTSIDVYALQRVKLVRARKNILDLMFMQMQLTKTSLEAFNASNTSANKANLNAHLNNLLEFTEPDRPYAGMCRFFIKKFMKENNLV